MLQALCLSHLLCTSADRFHAVSSAQYIVASCSKIKRSPFGQRNHPYNLHISSLMDGQIASSSARSFERLPVDILCLITGLLSGFDIANLVLCGSLRMTRSLRSNGGVKSLILTERFLDHFPLLFLDFTALESLEINISIDNIVNTEPISACGVAEERKKPIFKTLKRLWLYTYKIDWKRRNTDDLTVNFASSFPSLTSLRLEGPYKSYGTFQLPPALTSLKLSPSSPYPNMLSALPEGLLRLELTAISGSLKQAPTYPKHLADLVIPDTSLGTLFPSYTSSTIATLSTLHCSAYDLQMDSFSTFLRQPQHLTHLYLNRIGWRNLSDENIIWPSALTHLYLFGRVEFDDENFGRLPRGLLRFGTSGGVLNVTSSGYSNLPRTLTDLSVKFEGRQVEHVVADAFARFMASDIPPSLTRLSWTRLGHIIRDDHLLKLPRTMQSLNIMGYAVCLTNASLLRIPPHLVSLRLSSFYGHMQCKHAKALPKTLKILHLRYYPRQLTPLVLSLLPKSITELDLLGYGHISLSERHIATLPPALLTLSAHLCGRIGNLSHLPRSLTYLELRNWKRLSGGCLGQLPSSLGTLKISGQNPSAITEEHLSLLPPRLTDITCNYPPQWTHAEKGGIAHALPKTLTSITFKRTPKLFDLRSFILNMPRLGYIIIEKPHHTPTLPLPTMLALKQIRIKQKDMMLVHNPTIPIQERFAFEEYDGSV